MTDANELTDSCVITSLSSNNILNAFTPFGDASLIRMGNMYANINQLAKKKEMQVTFDMVHKQAATILNKQSANKIDITANFGILEAKKVMRLFEKFFKPWLALK